MSDELYHRARKYLPGGVNSSTRHNNAIGKPLYLRHSEQGRIWDTDGKEYIDMCCGHGAGLLGHGHPGIEIALRQASSMGYGSAFETEYHVELARQVCAIIPCADRVRFCSSGSEATLHLIRACRAFTGKDKIIRVEGHFHGYHEMIYIGGHPPESEQMRNKKHPYIESPGIPATFADLIIPVPFNDRQAIAEVIEKHVDEIALIICEPVNYNCGCIKPERNYLEFLREITKENEIVLFFDEIQSSFKTRGKSAQADFGVVPDVCTVGKSLGGGFPLSAFCGRAEIMDCYKPVGAVQHSGTFNAHLVPVLTGLVFLDEASEPAFYDHLEALESRFHVAVDDIIAQLDLNMTVAHHGARFNMLLGRKSPARRYEETFCHDEEVFLAVLRDCIEAGVYFHDYGGGPAHHGYSVQHTEADIDQVVDVLGSVLAKHRHAIARVGNKQLHQAKNNVR